MIHLFGNDYTRQDLLRHVGDISQIARIKPYRLVEGLEDGVFALDVTTGTGLAFTVIPSRGLDIATASYQGRPLAWRSSTTDTHPAYFDHEGESGRGWLRGFYGGLVVTCGLSYAGAAGEDHGQLYGLHGRVSNLPATNVSWDGAWQGDDYVLTIRGKIRETTVFGENLQLTRTIEARLGESRLFLHDEIENLGYQTSDHMMLYHINIGFPIVSAQSRLLAPSMHVTPRDEEAVDGQELYAAFQAPQRDYREKVYFHQLATDEGGRATTAIVNPALALSESRKGLGVYCTFRPEQLPRFTEWKMMGEGTYVVGMEPANCSVLGRAQEREAGTLARLAPGQVRQYDLEIGVLEGEAPLHDLETRCQKAVGAALPPREATIS